MKLIHTDLKPENMMFVNSSYDMEYNPNVVSPVQLVLQFSRACSEREIGIAVDKHLSRTFRAEGKRISDATAELFWITTTTLCCPCLILSLVQERWGEEGAKITGCSSMPFRA